MNEKTLVAIFLMTACNLTDAERIDKRQGYDKSAYGELPQLPNGEILASQDAFLGLIKKDGSISIGKVKKQAAFAIGRDHQSDYTCQLSKGTELAIAGIVKTRSGKKYAIAGISQKCQASATTYANKELTDAPRKAIHEAYVEMDDVVILEKDDIADKEDDTIEVGQDNLEGCKAVTITGDDQQSNSHSGAFAPGGAFRNAELDLSLAIDGKASKWRITSTNNADANSVRSGRNSIDIPDVIVEGSMQKVPFAAILLENDWRSTYVTFTVSGLLNDQQTKVGEDCEVTLRLMSPLVFDLSYDQKFRTIEPFLIQSRFDLDGDGDKEKSGWIYPTSAFLAMDHNSNGRIDDGTELFGEYSFGARYANGYEALKSLDGNRDNYVDKQDPGFSKLKLWTDKNMNGQTDPGELRSMDDASVTKIAVAYVSTNNKSKSFGNKVLYTAKFYGPSHCGVRGCASYDVFFATISQEIAKN